MPFGEVILLRMGALVGAGLFLGLGFAADLAGPSIILAMILAGLLAVAGGFAWLTVDRIAPAEGGAHAAARKTWPVIGGMAGWIFLAGRATLAALAAVMAAGYLISGGSDIAIRGVAVAFVLVFAGLALAGVRIPPIVAGYTAALALACLALFLGMTLPLVESANLRPFLARGWSGVLSATALLFAAWVGYARPGAVTEGVLAPERDAERAMPASLLMTLVLYAAIALAAVGSAGMLLSGRMLMTNSENAAPLLTAASFAGLPTLARGAVLVAAVLAAITTLPALLGDLSRGVVAMARVGDLPPVFVASWGTIPWAGLVVAGTAAALLAAAMPVSSLLAIAAGMALLHEMVAHILVVRFCEPSPARVAVHTVATLACLVLVTRLPFGGLRAVLMALVAAGVLLLARRLWKTR